MSTNNPMSNIPPLGPPTGTMPGNAQSKFKPVDPLRVLRANWLWIALGLIFGCALGGGAWFLLNKYIPKYTSDAQFRVEATNIEFRGGGLARMQELEPLILGEVQAVIAEPTLRQTLNSPAVQQTKWFSQFNNNLDDAFEDLDENVLRANHIRDTSLFMVRASTQDAQDAQIILTALRDEYMRIKRIEYTIEDERKLRTAQTRLSDAEERITSSRAAITRFLTDTPIETLREETSEAALQVSRLVVEVNELRKSLNSIQATYNLLLQRREEGNFEPSDEERAQIEQGFEIGRIDEAIRTLRVERESLLDQFGVEHTTVRRLDQQILSYERERKAEFDTQARTLFNATLEQARNGIDILQQEVAISSEELAEWTIKRQDNVRLMQEYETLVREQEQAEAARQLALEQIDELKKEVGNEARITVEEAYPPQKAKQSFPPEPYIMIPGIGILIAGLVTGLIFLREVMDQHVRSAADVKMIPDAALVGLIPDANEDQAGNRKVERVVELQPSGLLAEAFRQVRTSVLSKIDRRGYKTLMAVSAKPGAGATTVAQNLGASCALSGRRVLIIDANFRRPGMASLMGLSGQPGLSDLLSGSHPAEQATTLIQPGQTEGLSLLPAGNTANAAVELFESPRFRELIAQLETEYDLLIIDAPPALLTSDAQLLSRHVDAMVLVSRARTDTRGMLQRLYRELDGQRADILGVILNGVQASAGGYLKRNFQEFHDYSGPERRSNPRTAPAPASNGSAISQAAAPAAIALEDDDAPDEDDDAALGGFDLDDSDDNKS